MNTYTDTNTWTIMQRHAMHGHTHRHTCVRHTHNKLHNYFVCYLKWHIPFLETGERAYFVLEVSSNGPATKGASFSTDLSPSGHAQHSEKIIKCFSFDIPSYDYIKMCLRSLVSSKPLHLGMRFYCFPLTDEGSSRIYHVLDPLQQNECQHCSMCQRCIVEEQGEAHAIHFIHVYSTIYNA